MARIEEIRDSPKQPKAESTRGTPIARLQLPGTADLYTLRYFSGICRALSSAKILPRRVQHCQRTRLAVHPRMHARARLRAGPDVPGVSGHPIPAALALALVLRAQEPDAVPGLGPGARGPYPEELAAGVPPHRDDVRTRRVADDAHTDFGRPGSRALAVGMGEESAGHRRDAGREPVLLGVGCYLHFPQRTSLLDLSAPRPEY